MNCRVQIEVACTEILLRALVDVGTQDIHETRMGNFLGLGGFLKYRPRLKKFI